MESNEAYDRMKIMLDATPLCCALWDESCRCLDCNEEAVKLFGLSSKQEYLDRFFELSPQCQPDGRLSSEQAIELTRQAFATGYLRFEWMHQKLNGEPMPSEVTLVRVKHGERYIVASYTRDLRELKATLAEMRAADERTKLMLDATPLCCNLWDEDFNNIDCNQEAVNLFELSSKQEYLDRFFELSPEYQPCGRLSKDKAGEYIRQAFDTGRVRFEWMHQKLNGEPMPSEVTLVRVKYGNHYIVAGYTRDLRELKATLAEMRKADERTKLMFDATPLCCNFWDENYHNIDCNQEAVNLFGLSSKQEYLDRFFELSPEYQPCGRLSKDMAGEYIRKAFDIGRARFEWMHQKLDGEPMPSEITLVRIKYGDRYIVAGYTRDLRELKTTLAEMRAADERTKIMLDATPLCSNFWDENYHNIDCNQEAVNLFGLSSKQEYLDRFYELSPEYQPDGISSNEKALAKIREAFETGRACFEWMHQKLDGDPIPSEITLVRVKRGGKHIVAGYTRDLRELKDTVSLLNKLEKLAFTDNLTGVYNRHYFTEHAKKTFSKAEGDAKSMFVVLFDLDHFKSINDTYGHIAGDVILKTIASMVQGILRPYDLFARYGGEEFIIFISQSSLPSAVRLAERIREEIANTKFTYMDQTIKVTLSMGVANQAQAGDSFEQVIDLADKALYKAKHNGRNRVEHY